MIRTEDINKFIVNKKATIKEVLKVIDRNKEGIALVVDDNLRLLGTITDGDIRRFILRNGDVNISCEKVMNTAYVCAKNDYEKDIISLLKEHRIRHIPLLDKNKRLIKLFVSDKIYDLSKEVTAVIMAGGEGKRLREVSPNLPKPLVKIDKKPVLEEVINNLKQHNITQIYTSLNYKAQTIKDYLGNGNKFGVDIKHIVEKVKLGTAGALSLLPENEVADTILVINADVLTTTNFESLINYYQDHRLLMCIVTKEYIFEIPFGVFDICNGYLVGIKEKPSQRFFCNAGIYVLNKEIIQFIPERKKFDMTDLMKVLVHKSLPIGIFPLYEYWIDIGDVNDYKIAKKEYNKIFKRRTYE